MGNYIRMVHDAPDMQAPRERTLEDFMVRPDQAKGVLIQGSETPNARLRRAGMVPVGEQILQALIEGDDEAVRDINEYEKSLEALRDPLGN